MCATSNPSHPYHRFNWGNTKSLKDLPLKNKINVREAILEFYSTHYSANIMKLVVCGDNSLDDMENWTRKSFGPIPNKSKPIISYHDLKPPFGICIDKMPLLTKILPLKEVHAV